MTDHLRLISVHVDEPDPGHFFWVLMESTQDSTVFGELMAAQRPEKSWEDALYAGVNRLIDLAQTVERGPRTTAGEDEDANPVG